jgi:hypothetical protein
MLNERNRSSWRSSTIQCFSGSEGGRLVFKRLGSASSLHRSPSKTSNAGRRVASVHLDSVSGDFLAWKMREAGRQRLLPVDLVPRWSTHRRKHVVLCRLVRHGSAGRSFQKVRHVLSMVRLPYSADECVLPPQGAFIQLHGRPVGSRAPSRPYGRLDLQKVGNHAGCLVRLRYILPERHLFHGRFQEWYVCL